MAKKLIGLGGDGKLVFSLPGGKTEPMPISLRSQAFLLIDCETYYGVLGIDEGAYEDSRVAYLELAKQYHPDKLASLPTNLKKVREDATEKFRQIKEAWDVISIPERRRQYDAGLRRLRDDSTKPPPPPASSASSSAYQAPPQPSPTASRPSPPPGGHASAGPRAAAQPAGANTGKGQGRSIAPGWMWLVAVAFVATLIAFKARQEDRGLGAGTVSSRERSKSVEEARGTPESVTPSTPSSPEQSKLFKETAEIGFWKDPATGLIWAGKDNGADRDPGNSDDDLDWNEAQSYCQNLDLGGHKGWRLPAASELMAIFDPTVTYTYRVVSAPSSGTSRTSTGQNAQILE